MGTLLDRQRPKCNENSEKLHKAEIMTPFLQLLSDRADEMERYMRDLFSDEKRSGEIERPSRLMQAIRHSALDGGKRLRPFFVIESANLFGVAREHSMAAASALECIHCYSLVHDDLPAMDDDDLRRGRPTTHKAYDEATAILAGDALLTLAFDILSQPVTHEDPQVRIDLVNLFAQCAGLGGMVGGQMLDLQAEGKTLAESEILTLQAMKTGALLRSACEAGAIIGKASDAEKSQLREFGLLVGQAFQLADDILDVTSDSKTMGKQTAKDADRGKGTLVNLLGLEECKRRADALLAQAQKVLEPFGERADILHQAARFAVSRKN